MYYVLVPTRYDGYTLYPYNRRTRQISLIDHELFTWKEYVNLHYIYDNVPDFRGHIFKISQKRTFKSFGVRFLSHDYDYRSMEHISQEEFYDLLSKNQA